MACGGETLECSDVGDSPSRLCGEVGVHGTAGGMVVERLGDTTQRLGMVEDPLSGSSGEAAIKCRRLQAVARRCEAPGPQNEAVVNTK